MEEMAKYAKDGRRLDPWGFPERLLRDGEGTGTSSTAAQVAAQVKECFRLYGYSSPYDAQGRLRPLKK